MPRDVSFTNKYGLQFANSARVQQLRNVLFDVIIFPDGTPCDDGYPFMATGDRLWPNRKAYWKAGRNFHGKPCVTSNNVIFSSTVVTKMVTRPQSPRHAPRMWLLNKCAHRFLGFAQTQSRRSSSKTQFTTFKARFAWSLSSASTRIQRIA